jgi:hypothetical protein
VCGDLDPEKMLFPLGDIKHFGEKEMHPDPKDVVFSYSIMQRKDNKIDKWAPRYQVPPQPLEEFTDPSSYVKFKLSNLGGCECFIAATIISVEISSSRVDFQQPIG